MKNKLLLLCLLALPPVLAFSQVGINTEEPNQLAELDIMAGSDEFGALQPRGIMIPRLTQIQRDRIDTTNVDAANGLFIYNTDEDCFNYFSRAERRWKSMCGSLGRSRIDDVDCSKFNIYGTFTEGKALTAGNYAEIPVVVGRAGTYDVSIVSKSKQGTPNGYAFSSSGTFLVTGSALLTIPGLGTPISSSYDESGTILEAPDTLVVYVNGKEYCHKTVEVEYSGIPVIYDLNCSAGFTVGGTYVANRTLTNQNTLSVTINALPSSFGATYEISTNVVNGYSFKGTGVITQSPQVVTLTGSGKPVLSGTDTFTVTSNSKGGSSVKVCTDAAKVNVAARAVKVTGKGENATYNIGLSGNGMYRVLKSSGTSIFGSTQSSLVPVDAVNIQHLGTSNSQSLVASADLNTGVDIIVVQYNWMGGGGQNYSNQIALINWVKAKKGVLILCTEDGSSRAGSACYIANQIMGSNISYSNTSTNLFTLSNSTINQAPYNIVGKQIARDAGNQVRFTNIDNSKMEAVANDSGSPYVLRSLEYGFFMIGDGAPFAYASGNTSPYNYPYKLDSSNRPMVGPNSTYNSHMFVNIMAWAIKYVQANNP